MGTPLSVSTERRSDSTLAVVARGEIDLSNIDTLHPDTARRRGRRR